MRRQDFGRFRDGPPPWWPEGSPWPPPFEQLQRRRRRFLIFVATAILVLFALIFLAGVVATKVFDHGGGSGGGRQWNGSPAFGLVPVLIAIFFIVRFLRRTARPIGEIMDATEQVARGDYSARVRVGGPPEMRRLSSSFNEMISRLETNDEQRRRLLADVTHELRTPLSIIRGNVEGMLDGLYPRDDEHLAPIVEETKQMARLLEDLHTLATAEAGALQLHREPTDITAMLSDLVAAFTPRATARGVAISQKIGEWPDVELDPIRIRQVLENVLSNALRYTPAGGEIAIETAIRGDRLVFAITDTGPGVAAADLPHLFDRFTKSSDSGGSGLGLAIARNLVQAHGGEITAENRIGHGLAVTIAIPTNPPE